MNWLFIFFFIMCSIHIYIHFIIHPEIRLSVLEQEHYTREEITNNVYYKLPFILNKNKNIPLYPINLNNYTKVTKREYIKEYDPLPLLEPLVKFFTKNTIFDLKKNKKIPFHSNLECRNFYIIHSGKVFVTLKNPNAITNELQFEICENQILFVPNYWNISIKSNEKSIVEKLQYSTIMNQANFVWDYIINIKTCSICI